MISFFKKIVPSRIRLTLSNKIINSFIEQKGKELHAIPQVILEKKHIQNVKILLNREELLTILPQGGVVAEIGVDEGHFSELLLKLNKPKKLHLIDLWGSERFSQAKQKSVEERYSDYINTGEVEINKGYSTDVVKRFNDKYFDWVYIDTDHSYRTTKEELEKYSAKVKEGGILAGHDFIQGNWRSINKYGVQEAVCEFCVNHNWEIVYLTADFHYPASFALRKIS